MRMIEITKRLCARKLQPDVKVGMRAFVRREDRLRDGTRVLVLASPEKEGKTLRVNAKRFQWREITMDTLLEERRERETRRDQELVMVTGYHGRSCQDARDAALLAWVYAGLPVRVRTRALKSTQKNL